jgi:hypothetical protein
MPEPVSLVIATYNRKAQLKRTLDTIFRQEYPALEVIVVDDGSTDGTEELEHRYPIRYIRLGRVGWTNMARTFNVGIRAASHDILIMQSGETRHLTQVSRALPPPPPLTALERYADFMGKLPPRPPWPRSELVWVPEGKSNAIRDLVKKVAADGMLWVLANCRAEPSEGSQEYIDYCSSMGRRIASAFFLSCLRRKWLMDIRGFDEDYIKAGHDDVDLALRLLGHVGLHQEFDDNIRCEHQWHEPAPYTAANKQMFVQKSSDMRAGKLSPIRNLGREWGVI